LFLINKKILAKCIILLFAISFSTCFSQNRNEADYFSYAKEAIYSDVMHTFNLGFALIKSPLNISGNDVGKAFYNSLITASLFIIDQPIRDFAQDNQSNFNDGVFGIDDYLNGEIGLIAGAVLYSGGFFSEHKQIRKMGLHSIETIFIASSITSFLKYSFGRSRPYNGRNHLDFGAFRGSKQEWKSFPSGHTTGAFAFASVMAMSIDNIIWKSAWYTGAALVGAARIYHNKHWLSDTFLAAIISYNVADYVVNFDKNNLEKRTNEYELSFSATASGIGLTIRF